MPTLNERIIIIIIIITVFITNVNFIENREMFSLLLLLLLLFAQTKVFLII